MTTATRIAEHASLEIQRSPSTHPSVTSRVKRCIDIVTAVLALTLGFPLALLVAIGVAITSRGPILFSQHRLGLHGRRFRLWKFRTMTAEAADTPHREYVLTMIRDTPSQANDQGAFKLASDRRITRFGAWLRRTSLDEYPQFVNVLIGDMSLVGPRPPLEYEVAAYESWQLERLDVRPGITGYWQVSGRNRLSYVQMCRRDIDYIRGWSLGRDISIIVRTPWVMIGNSGKAA